MICFFVISEKKKKKKKLFVLGVWPIVTPFLHKLGPKMAISRGFSKKFSEVLDYK